MKADYIINMLKDLIKNPDQDAVMEPEIAGQLKLNASAFRQSAQEFTEKYAK